MRAGHFVLNRESWKPIVFPAGVVLLVAALLLHSEMLAISATAVSSYYYAVFLAGFLLAARFHSTRVLFSLTVLMLAHRALEFFSNGKIGGSGPGRAAFELLALLVPINFLALVWMRERGMKVPAIMPRVAMLLAQAFVVTLACRPGTSGLGFLSYPFLGRAVTEWSRIPHLALLAFAATAAVFAVRFVRMRKPLETGFFWSLVSVFLSFQFGGVGRLADGYMATAGLILVASVVETSYVMAYHDELTALPGRRAFNEALVSLEGQYAIAIVDIDHFKQFNDTYGHETGDEVLRMVAARLARVTGGGKAFRCGGEEFAILFEGKSAKDAAEDLDLLRRVIETSMFRVRGGQERRREPRQEAAERRTPMPRKIRSGKSPTIVEPVRDLSVTVSIGVAEPSTRLREVDQIIHAADKALYRAKGNGRNRVELATSARVRPMRARKASA
jgi:diguanylate cyclase (GGDEF)-like protein